VSLRLLLAALVVPAAAAAPLDGQYPRLTGRVSPAVATAVVPVLDSARAAGLPTDLLEAKVLEGVTKGADAGRIVAAVRRLSVDLGEARRALGEAASARELAAGAGALRAGLTPADLERIRHARGGRDVAVALEVATDLIARSVPIDTASRVVLRAVGAGVSDGDLEQLRLAVERDVANGVPAPVAASLRSRILVPRGP
jgi:hypothetical protein